MGFKENFKMLRKTKGLTQEEFGKLINKSKLTIIRYEKGETFPNLEILKEICKIFDIELTDFLMNIKYENKKYTFEEIKKLLRYKRNEVAHNVSHDIVTDGHKGSTEDDQFWQEYRKNSKVKFDKIYNSIVKEVEKKDFYNCFKNINNVESFINDFFIMLNYELLEENKDISDKDKIRILEDLKKYYLFLISNYKNND